MARCTAPINGHKTANGAANCPACRGGSRYGYGSHSYSSSSYYSSGSSGYGSSSRSSGSSSSGRTKRAKWSRSGSTATYTSRQIESLTPVRETVEQRSKLPDLRDLFLCHAWDDRKGAAKELHDLIEKEGATVWFSEKDVALGTGLMREIDKGISNSKIGIVLVTPAFIKKIKGDGAVAEKELSALMFNNQLVPIVHNTTYEKLREVSPILASKSGLDTSEDSMKVIAEKLADLVSTEEQ